MGFSSPLGPLVTESERETQVRLCLSASSYLPESRGKDLRRHGTKNTVRVDLVSGKSICMRTSDDIKHVFSRSSWLIMLLFFALLLPYCRKISSDGSVNR